MTPQQTHDITITGTIPTNDTKHIQNTYKQLTTAGKLIETMDHNTYYNNQPQHTTIYATLEINAPNNHTAHNTALQIATKANIQNPQTNNRT